MDGRPRIGVLALQGAFREHARALGAAGADVVEVRLPEQLDGLDGLVIPGGESTTITKLATLYGLDEAIRSFDGADLRHLRRHDPRRPGPSGSRRPRGRPERLRPAGRELRGRPRHRRRGRPFRGVFIRAPRVRDVGPHVEVLAELDGEPVLLRDGRVLVAAFHPELTDDPRVHERFLELVTEATSVRA